MIMAAIGAIDGNFSALDAVLRAIEEAGIQTVAHTGNAVVGGVGERDCDLVIEALQAHTVICVQGETDRRVARYQRMSGNLRKRLNECEVAALERAFANTHSRHLEYLHSLPGKRRCEIDGIGVVVCFGSVSSRSEILTHDTPILRLRREREIEPADIIVCGGARTPFSRLVDGALFVSPGPLEDTMGRACYTVIDTEQVPWRADIHTLQYKAG